VNWTCEVEQLAKKADVNFNFNYSSLPNVLQTEIHHVYIFHSIHTI